MTLMTLMTIISRMRQHKSSPGRSKALIYSSILLGLNSTRALGGVVLLAGLKVKKIILNPTKDSNFHISISFQPEGVNL